MNKTILCHNKEAYNDLSIENELFQNLDRTITNIGSIKLKNRLLYCLFDVDDLELVALRNFTVHQDTVYRYDMEQYLNTIKSLEPILNQWMLNECNKRLVFNWSFLNNRYMLTISNKLKFTSMVIILVVYLLVYLYMRYCGMMLSPTEYVKGIVTSYYQFIKLLCYIVMNNQKMIEWTAFSLASLYIGYQLYMTYQSVNTSYEHYVSCNNFYTDYEKIRTYIDAVEKMTQIETFFDIENVKLSIDYLRYYFTKNVSLGFSLVANLGSADYVKHIDVIVNYVGRVDCQLCIARLVDEGYVIPKFVKAQFPILHVEGVWNPIISYDSRIKNSLVMDVTKPNVMIITGPNKAGKSTFMRSIITAVYLSQSIGISCCDKISLTPFRDLFTYLNVPDCLGRESLFEAELNRCYNYIERIESLKGFSIGIVDELFTGTNPKEGKAASYAILKRISENPTNITLLSTHFHDIIDNLSNGSFMFNKFTARRDGGQYVFDYKIHDGVSDQCIALQLLQDRGFDKDIVNDAIMYIENISKKQKYKK